MTPQATAPMIATAVQMTIERARDFVLTSYLPRDGDVAPLERLASPAAQAMP